MYVCISDIESLRTLVLLNFSISPYTTSSTRARGSYVGLSLRKFHEAAVDIKELNAINADIASQLRFASSTV